MSELKGSKILNAGTLSIDLFILKSLHTGEELSIVPLVREISIYESFNHYPTMDIVLEDSLSLVTTFPIVGEETVIVHLSIPDPSFSKSIKHEFRVSSVNNLYRGGQVRKSIYMLRCVSKEHIKELTTHIRKSYSNQPISKMVDGIFQSYLNSEYDSRVFQDQKLPCNISDTEGNRTIVIPNMRPKESIKFLCRESKSSEYKASNFVFYKTLDGFNFKPFDEIIDGTKANTIGGIGLEEYFLTEKSIDGELTNTQPWSLGNDLKSNPEMSVKPATSTLKNFAQTIFNDHATEIEKVSNFIELPKDDKQARSSRSGKPIAWQKITDFKIHTVFDIEDMLKSGAYDNTVFVVNPANQYFDKKTYNYNKDYDSLEKITQNDNGRVVYEKGDLANLAGDSNINYIVSNFGTGVDNQDTKLDFMNLLIASRGLLNHIVADITIVGDTERRIGDTILVQLPEFSSTDDMISQNHRLLAGSYLITDIRHHYNPETGYNIAMRCVKNAYEESIDVLMQKAEEEARKRQNRMVPFTTESLLEQIKNPDTIVDITKR
ncbi:baseplate hub subunit and tail lysozyme [Ochrobactrum phage vB_OspM_OC]|nr:baseplate hub subunit and tail lysozyme [Ochrobactrum phage vB_OspM_OC]